MALEVALRDDGNATIDDDDATIDDAIIYQLSNTVITHDMRARRTGHTARLLPSLQFIMNFLRTEFELQIAFTEMYMWFTVGVMSCMAACARRGVLSGAVHSVGIGIVAHIAIVYRRIVIVYHRIVIVYRCIVIVYRHIAIVT